MMDNDQNRIDEAKSCDNSSGCGCGSGGGGKNWKAILFAVVVLAAGAVAARSMLKPAKDGCGAGGCAVPSAACCPAEAPAADAPKACCPSESPVEPVAASMAPQESQGCCPSQDVCDHEEESCPTDVAGAGSGCASGGSKPCGGCSSADGQIN